MATSNHHRRLRRGRGSPRHRTPAVELARADNALTVPPPAKRMRVLGFLRHVSHQLRRASNNQTSWSPPRSRGLPFVRTGSRSSWQTSPERPAPPKFDVATLRAVGDQVGERFRALAKEARERSDRSARAPSLRDGSAPLAEAALRGRLADPAAPLANPDPVAALQRQRRQSFLLWQAQRATTEGWANVGSTSTRTRPANPDDWYCRKAALNLILTAEGLIRDNATELSGRPMETLSPGELDRWLGGPAGRGGRSSQRSTPTRPGVAVEPDWTFAFSMSAAEGRGGIPVSWLTAPGKPPRRETAAQPGAWGPTSSEATSGHAAGPLPPPEAADEGQASSQPRFYRGHL